MYAGTIRPREKYSVVQKSDNEWVSSDAIPPPALEIQIKTLETISGAKLIMTSQVSVGEIGVLTSVDSLQVGDIIGVHCDSIRTVAKVNPIFSANIYPVQSADRLRLLDALYEMNLEDGQLDFAIDESKISVKLFGELQKEFIKTHLSDKYGIDAEFSETQTIFKETPAGIGKSELGLVSFIVEPLPRGAGVHYEYNRGVGITGGLTTSMHTAVRESSLLSLVPGALMVNENGVVVPFRPGAHGWEVTDIKIIFDACSGRADPSEFRQVSPYSLRQAIWDAGTQVLQPIYCYEIVVHAEYCGKTVNEITNHSGSIASIEDSGAHIKLSGKLPARMYQAFLLQFQSITKNMGSFDAVRVEYELL